MIIQQINIFQTLCSDMNYSKAAEKLFMTRQAVRQNVSAMVENSHRLWGRSELYLKDLDKENEENTL